MYLWIFTSLWKISKLYPPEIASGLSISILVLEFAKLRAFCAYMPYAPTCQCALRAYASYVPQITTWLRAYIPSFFTCLRAYMRIHIFPAYVPLCLKLFRTYVRSFFSGLCAYNYSQNIFRFTSIPCIAVFFWIIWPFIPSKTLKQTPASKTAYPNPILRGFFISSTAYTETII